MSAVEIAPCRPSSRVPTSAEGRLATIPAKMMSEEPLPMPREVICSPSHIRNMVPPVSVITVEMTKNSPGILDDVARALQPDGDPPGLEDGENDREVARVLVQDLAAGLAFLLQRLERRHDRGEELDDDRGRDVRHDVEREDRHALDGAAREHVEQPEHAAGLVAAKLCRSASGSMPGSGM